MNARRLLLEIYWKIRGIITPTLRYAQDVYEDVLEPHVTEDVAWLDLGCGHQILPSWRAEEETRLVRKCRMVVGLDFDWHSLKKNRALDRKAKGDIARLPFKDRTFDLVTANMVVEHLDSPPDQFQEVRRVLKPGGKFIFHTPNEHGHFAVLRKLTPRRIKDTLVRLLDGRPPEDVFEVRYKANSRAEIGRLAEISGLEVEKTKMIVSDAVFAVIPPLAMFELLWIKMLMTEPLKPLRTNIIALLRRPRGPGGRHR